MTIKGAMFGNIIFGGGIGAIIDHVSGAAYEYPTFIQVIMGSFVKVETQPSDKANEAADTSQAPSATPAQSPATIPAKSGAPTQTVEAKLSELKKLHDDGLITTPIYLERQRIVLDERP